MSKLKFNTCATSCACSFATTAAESILKRFKKRAIRTGVFAGCASGRKTSAPVSVYGAGQAGEQKWASPFRLTSRNEQPMIAVLGKGGARYDERQLHPSLERRRPPLVPGGCRRH